MMRGEGGRERRAIMDDVKREEREKAAEPPGSSDTPEITKLGEDIGEGKSSELANSPEPVDDKSVTPAAAWKSAPFPFPLKMTQQTWLIAATMLVGLVTLVILGRMTGKSKAAGEHREERTVASLTPESLAAKCGAPAEDVTKDLYPMIKRTMSYKSSAKGTLTFEFSRTAEEKSDWVFLSMSDENGATYGTPETQIAAMPCLK
jgi:hypothetical protein